MNNKRLALVTSLVVLFWILTVQIALADSITPNVHYTFNQSASPFTSDGSDGNLDLTGTGTFGAGGKLNGSYLFTSGVVNTASGFPSTQVNASSNFSMMLWFNKTANNAGGSAFARTGSTTATNDMRFYLDLEADGRAQAGQTEFGVGGAFVNSILPLTSGIWSWLYLEVSGGNISLYVNNTFQGTESMALYQGKFTDGILTIGGISVTFATSSVDDFRFYNRTLNATERAFIYNSFVGTENITYPPAGVAVATIIDNATYNLSSANNIGNATAWRQNKSYPAITYDLTPTVKFDVNQIANCTISLNDYNYTRSVTGLGTYFNCSEVMSLNHTCTYGSNLPTAVQNIYLACSGSNLTNSTSGFLRLDVHRNITILNATYNFTNALNIANMTAWRQNQSYPAMSFNLTPLIRFNTSEVTNCTISTLNRNWTNITIHSGGVYFNCSNANSLNQSCLYSTSLSFGIQNIYLACQHSESVLSTSGALGLNLSLNASPVVANTSFVLAFDNNVSDGQFYEYETTITVNISWTNSSNMLFVSVSGANILSNFNFSVNSSLVNSSVFNISIFDVFENKINGSQNRMLVLQNNTFVNWNYSHWYVMNNLSFNLSLTNGSNYLDVKVLLNGVLVKTLYGYLNDSTLQTRNFSTTQNASAFVISSTDIAAVYLKIPTSRFINLTVNLTGVLSNPVGFDRSTYLFLNGSDVENTTGLFVNLGVAPFFIDDLVFDKGYWSRTGNLGINNYSNASRSYNWSSTVTIFKPGSGETGTFTSTQSGYWGWSELNINDYDVFGVNYSCTTSAGSIRYSSTPVLAADASCALYFGNLIDGTGTNTFIDGAINSYSATCSGPCTGYNFANHTSNVWIIRSNATSNVWNVTNGTYPGTFLRQITLVNQTLYLLGYGLATATVSGDFNDAGETTTTINGRVDGLLMGGFGGRNARNGSYGNNFSVVSEDQFTATQNISGVILYTKEYTPLEDDDYVINYFVSANNGTNWEVAVPGTFHKFTNTGRVLRWKVNGTSANTTSNFGVTNVRAVILATSPSNITLDLGGDNSIETSISGVFNYTLLITMNDINNSLANYVADNCEGLDVCVVPINVQSSTPGEVTFNNLVTRSSANPIILTNVSNKGNLSFLALASGFRINVSDWRHNFAGDFDNVTFNVQIVNSLNVSYNITRNINVRYTPFNVSSVKNFLNFFPKSKFSYNLSPDGQKTTLPFYNVTSISFNHSAKIFVNTYRPLLNCTALYLNRSGVGKTTNISGGVRGQNVLNLSSNVSTGLWISLDYMNCTQGQEVRVVFNSLCIDCVKTVDYDTGNQTGRSV